ncbi:hypothetical protein D3C73_1108340 [compost metagenome]
MAQQLRHLYQHLLLDYSPYRHKASRTVHKDPLSATGLQQHHNYEAQDYSSLSPCPSRRTIPGNRTYSQYRLNAAPFQMDNSLHNKQCRLRPLPSYSD